MEDLKSRLAALTKFIMSIDIHGRFNNLESVTSTATSAITSLDGRVSALEGTGTPGVDVLTFADEFTAYAALSASYAYSGSNLWTLDGNQSVTVPAIDSGAWRFGPGTKNTNGKTVGNVSFLPSSGAIRLAIRLRTMFTAISTPGVNDKTFVGLGGQVASYGTTGLSAPGFGVCVDYSGGAARARVALYTATNTTVYSTVIVASAAAANTPSAFVLIDITMNTSGVITACTLDGVDIMTTHSIPTNAMSTAIRISPTFSGSRASDGNLVYADVDYLYATQSGYTREIGRASCRERV